MKNRFFWIFVIIATALTYVGCVITASDASPTTLSLDALTPIIAWISDLGRPFNEQGYPLFAYSGACVCTVLLLMGLQLRSGVQNLLFACAIFAVGAQLLLIDSTLVATLSSLLQLSPTTGSSPDTRIILGSSCYVISALLFILASRRPTFPDPFSLAQHQRERFSAYDCVLLLAVFCVAVVIRMYALNHILNYFEGEMSPYSAAGTSLVGMLYAHEGWWGPWAPLGYLYYLPIYLTTKLFGTTLVALRLASVIVGLLTIPLVYILGARLGGKFGGHCSAIIYSLNFLHIGWHRSDIYPHGATTWPSILLCLCLLNAATSGRVLWAAATAFMMGLSWHQYPSGQSAVMIPIVAIALCWLFNRSTKKIPIRQALVTGSGVLLWAAGLPLTYYVITGAVKFANPFNLTGNRTIWGEAGTAVSPLRMAVLTIERSLLHLGYVFEGMFFRARHIFHQEWLSYQAGFSSRTVGWLVLAFAVIGLFCLLRFRKRIESCVMFGWMAAAVMPGILSSVPYPKRLSTLYPAIDITAGIGLATLWYATTLGGRAWRLYLGQISVIVASLAWLTFTTHFWFSKRFFPTGEPPENAVAAQLAAAITPRTIVLAELTRGYEAGKYLYLMMDYLTAPENRPNLWLQTSSGEVRSFLESPINFEKAIESRLPYIWTKLRDQIEETVAFQDWQDILFVLQRGDPSSTPNDQLIQAVIARCSNPTVSDLSPSQENWNSLVLIRCPYSDFKNR